MGVGGDEHALFVSAEGRYGLRRLGAVPRDGVAGVLGCDTASLTVRTGPAEVSGPAASTGTLLRVEAAYGRCVSVTPDQGVLMLEQGGPVWRTAGALVPGDRVVIPQRVPRVGDPWRRIDLAGELKTAGADGAVRIEGEAVRRLRVRQAVARQPTHLRRNERRVRVPLEHWRRLKDARRRTGITGAEMARRIGYRQACSISEFETCRSLPTEDGLRRYLAELDMEWPAEAEFVDPLVQSWASTSDSTGNARYRKTSAAAWLPDLSRDDLLWLAGEPDSHELNLYACAHRAEARPRFLELDEPLGHLLGWYLAEGSQDTRGRLAFSLGADDIPYEEELLSAIETVCGRQAKIDVRDDRPGLRSVIVHSGMLARWLKTTPLGTTARDKTLPDVILNAGPAVQMAFLEGYFLGDGTKARKGDRIQFATASRALVDALCSLFLQFGVLVSWSTRRPMSAEHRGQVIHSGESYVLTVTSLEAMERLRFLWRQVPWACRFDARLGGRRTRRRDVTEMTGDLVAVPVRAVRQVADGPSYTITPTTSDACIAGTGGLVLRAP
ncbi:hypothetical protein SRB5_30950 [Streptomyces sp. RB5]|uniref:DOD-type homing endonuclease domain-containing protein n=1 Tax=Streptomyces smaragdinus TaxID=2585196 RepID=A0A7K0CHQ6_9ACTN|nr:LAGLIDADG family homing endonuclease [Streptomyces smaragdinus]MQY12956.1 hypothetical protein [Streptomyces smaragdinus]